jgi:flagellar M-ring protein FliF
MEVNETLRGVIVRLTSRWNGFTSSQKRNIVIAFVAIIAALSATLWVLMRPNYVTIMSGLDDKSMGQVQSKLQDLKIPAQLTGSSVLVPSQDANTARVQLAMAGLPQSGYIGYSSIQNSFGMTQDQFNIQVLDALQQSLNQTIQSIDGIESAEVHIVMPQQQVFVSQPEDTAKASVFVEVAPGVQLSSQQVSGIQELVAHSVKGLSAADVTVTDENGVTLSSVSATNPALGTSGASTELQMKQQLEQEKTQQLSAGLSQIVGPGNAVVMVHADVTFNQVKSDSHTVTPVPGTSTGLPTSSQTSRYSSSSNSGAAGGPTGVASTNPGLPSYAGASGSTGNSTSSNTTTTTNYDNSYTNTQTVSDPIQVKGYTVGVFLNSSNGAISPATINQIKSFVANAIGQSTTGSESNITVSSVPFHTTSKLPVVQQSKIALYGGIAGGLSLLGAIVWVLMRRKKRTNQFEYVESTQVLPDNDLLEDLPKTEEERMKDQLVNLANQKPDDFANLLRTWLAD